MKDKPTTVDLDWIKRREAAATKGPWEYTGDTVSCVVTPGDDGYPVADTGWNGAVEDANNGLFIAHARTDIPRLIAAVEERDAEIERLRALVACYERMAEASRAHQEGRFKSAEDILHFLNERTGT